MFRWLSLALAIAYVLTGLRLCYPSDGSFGVRYLETVVVVFPGIFPVVPMMFSVLVCNQNSLNVALVIMAMMSAGYSAMIVYALS
ncbi:hypothetical protein EV668_2049 [Enterovirga rhinocerotis]|uniref:Uncharacterized protein n=1 Tax=Enterovirga rhinocerotis TaxID=1339210 RepID=A0A4R7C802_9HYPH|nr:hypothetical protein EV668_2049 [Enterovirga rhinocerotis]